MSKTDLRVVLGVDGEAEFSAKMKKLSEQQREISSQIKAATTALGSSASAYDKAKASTAGLSEKIAAQEEKVKLLREAYEKSVSAKGEDDATTIRLKTSYQNAQVTLNKMNNELEDNNKLIKENSSKSKEAAQRLTDLGIVTEKVGDTTKKVGDKMSRYFTTAILATGAAAAKAAIEYEDAFAGVKKTVDGTAEQMHALSDEILDISTRLPVSANEIAGVAEAAGQLGIAVDDIGSFTEVMVGLGISTNISAEDAATALAKFANITKISADDYSRLGATIVGLGNNFATSESEIVAMTTRLAATGAITGKTEPQILGISTALSSVGIEAEAGGGALSKLMKRLEVSVKTYDSSNEMIKKTGKSLRELEQIASWNGSAFKDLCVDLGVTQKELKTAMTNVKSLEQYAGVANMTAQDFITAYGKDSVKALGSFINGLKDTQRNGKGAIEILQDMGLTEVRLSNAVLALANSDDILTKSVDAANTEWKENNALQNEVGKRMNTTGAKLITAKNEMIKTAVILGDNFLPTIANVAGNVGVLAEKFGALPAEQQKAIAAFALIVAGTGPVISTFGKLTAAIGTTGKGVGKLIKTANSIRAGTYTGPLNTVLQLLGKNSSATAALAGDSAKLAGVLGASGPLVTAFIGVAAVATTAYIAYNKMTEGGRHLTSTIEDLCAHFGAFDEEVANAQSLLSGLNVEIIDSETQAQVESNISAVQEQITEVAKLAAEQRRALTQQEIDRLNELFEKLNQLTQQEMEFATTYQEAVINMAQATSDYSKENAQSLIKDAQDTKDTVLAAAKSQYNSKLILIKKAYEDEGTLSQEAFEQQRAAATQEYEAAIAETERKFADTYSLITEGYYQQNIAGDEQLQRYIELHGKMEETNGNYRDKLAEINNDMSKSESQKLSEITLAWFRYQFERDAIQDEMANAMEALNQDELAAWIEMSANCEFYGGEISNQAKNTADGFIGSYNDLPYRAKKKFKETMQGMIEGIRERSRELYDEAAKTVGGFINRIRTTLGIASPSKVMKQIFKHAVEGGEIGTREERPKLLREAENTALSFADAFADISPDITANVNTAFENFDTKNFPQRVAALGIRSGEMLDRFISPIQQLPVQNQNHVQNTDDHRQDIGALIKIENMTVRNDNDIQKLSKQLEAVSRNLLLGRGVKV